MKRKKFIFLSITGVIATGFPSLIACRKSLEYPQSLSRPLTVGSIRDPEQLQKIGKAYLDRVPGESDKRSLVRLLSKDIPSDSTAMSGHLKQQIQYDFEAGDTVMVDGWILSATEARQCALYYLERTR